MKVGLAAETLSRSVACAMLFCKNIGLSEFNECENTVKFFKTIDLLFDNLNSCHPMDKSTKSPISKKNQLLICNQIENCIIYL